MIAFKREVQALGSAGEALAAPHAAPDCASAALAREAEAVMGAMR
jgi:hypothetical protein